MMDRLNIPEDQPIENRLVGRAIEQAQVKVEGHNFDMRKNVVEYDDVMNQQRDVVYSLRHRVLSADNLKDEIEEKLSHQVDRLMLLSTSVESEKLSSEELIIGLTEIIPFDDASRKRIEKHVEDVNGKEELQEFLLKLLGDVYTSREKELSNEVMRQVEKYAYLGSIDKLWIEHIDNIDTLREGVRFRQNPIVEFKKEAYDMFEGLLDSINQELARRIFRIQVARQMPTIPLAQARTNIDSGDAQGLIAETADDVARSGQKAFGGSSTSENAMEESVSAKNASSKLGRNDPCWCGSGKKFKKCHYPQTPQ